MNPISTESSRTIYHYCYDPTFKLHLFWIFNDDECA